MSEPNFKPTVATITATFNRAHTLERVIKSCQNQSYSVNEIIIVDDGSTDSTPALVANLMSKDPRIRYLRLPVNQGQQFALIEGIKMSECDWVALIDSDDELLPHSIEVRLSAAHRCDFLPGLVFGDYYSRRSERHPPIKVKYERFSGYVYPQLFRRLLIVAMCTLMIRKDCFKVSGYPDPFWPHLQEWDMTFTIAKHFPLHHCGEAVSIMYGDAGNRVTESEWRTLEGCKLWIKKYAREILRYQGPLCLLFWFLFLVYLRLFYFRRHIQRWHEQIFKTMSPALFLFKVVSFPYRRFLDYTVDAVQHFFILYFKVPPR